MRRLLALALLPLAGCARAPREAVWVDLARVAVERDDLSLPSAPNLTPPSPGSAVQLPGLPAVEVTTRAKDVAAAERRLAEQQEETRRRLERSLRNLYARLARRFELARTREEAEKDAGRYDALDRTIRALFERWADERAPKLIRLDLLVGFPDPNPEDKPIPEGVGNVTRRRLEEASRLRRELKAGEREFEDAVDALLAQVDAEVASARAALRLEIERYRAEGEDRARRAAAEAVRQAQGAVTLRLTGPARVSLPAEPARTSSAPDVPAPKGLAGVTSADVRSAWDGQAGATRRAMLEGQLRTWLSLGRRELRPGARDATEEFAKWRRENGFGAWASSPSPSGPSSRATPPPPSAAPRPPGTRTPRG